MMIDFDERECRAAIELINVALMVRGLEAAEACLTIARKFQAALIESAKPESGKPTLEIVKP